MKRILSGITPSGDGSLHIGNYLGAIKQFIEIAKTYECFLMFADLHALTTVQNNQQLQKNTETLILNEIALVGELPNVYFFRQSDVPMHTELQTILNNITPLGLLKRAHAYKDKLQKDAQEDEINLGLFNYPILMASDILLYKPDMVPVGKDQKQHIEITRDIGDRFNKIFKTKVFPLPEPHIPKDVAVVLGTDGQRKMSKSLGNLISIFESEEIIKKQVNGTFTDPTRKHATDPGHIDGNMVFTYLDHFGENKTVQELKIKYTEGKVGDVEVKGYLVESLLKYFAPARKRFEELSQNPQKVNSILEMGTAKAHSVAASTMKEVRQVIGLTNRYSFFSYGHLERSERSSVNEKNKNASLDFSVLLRNDTMITIDEFARIEQRVGLVVEAKNAVGSEKLIRLVVDFGKEVGQRIVFTGVRPFGYTPEFFQDKQFLFIVNLASRKMMNEESQGMILAVDDSEQKKPIFVSGEGMPIGAIIR